MNEGYYDINMDGFTAGPYTAEELAEGINMAVIPDSPIAKRADKIYSDLSASFYVAKEELRNLRSLEQEVIKRAQAMPDGTPNKEALINLDDEAVMQYVEDTTDLTGRTRYIENKPHETELIKKFMTLLAKVREDANEAPEPINISVTSHKSKGSELVIFADGFTNRNSSYDESKWMLADFAPSGTTPESAGTTSYDYTEGSTLENGSGVGAAKITIGIDKYKNGYTLTNGPKSGVDYKYNRPHVLPGQKLDVSAAVKTDNVRATDTVDLSVIFYDKNNENTVGTETKISDSQKGTHDWQTIRGVVTVPDDAYYMRLDVSARSQTEGATEKQGTVWFDDVRVTSSLQNPDFEDASNGVADAWTTSDIANPIPENYNTDLMTFKSNWTVGANSNTVTGSYDTENYVTGGRSLKFVSTASGNSTDRSYYHAGTNYIKLKPNTNYKITMKAKADNYQLLDDFSQTKPAGLTYQAILYKETNGAADTSQTYTLANSYLNVPGNTTTAITEDWKDYSMVLTTPAAAEGQTYVYLRSNVMMRFASGTAWVDSITIAECDADGNVTSQNIDTENKVSGQQSLIVKGGSNGVTYSSEPIIVAGTQKYLLSAYAKKDAAATGKISIETYNSKRESLGSIDISVTSTDFAKVQQEVTIPEGAVYAVIKLYAKDGNMNVDAVGLSKFTGERDLAYTYTEGSPVQPEPSSTPETEPTSTPEPSAEATPGTEPTSTPVTEPTATPGTEPTSTPGIEPTSTPVTEPTATPITEPTSTPGTEPTTTPIIEPTSTPVTEPTSTPVTEPTSTPGIEPTSTPGIEPTSTPAATAAATPLIPADRMFTVTIPSSQVPANVNRIMVKRNPLDPDEEPMIVERGADGTFTIRLEKGYSYAVTGAKDESGNDVILDRVASTLTLSESTTSSQVKLVEKTTDDAFTVTLDPVPEAVTLARGEEFDPAKAGTITVVVKNPTRTTVTYSEATKADFEFRPYGDDAIMVIYKGVAADNYIPVIRINRITKLGVTVTNPSAGYAMPEPQKSIAGDYSISYQWYLMGSYGNRTPVAYGEKAARGMTYEIEITFKANVGSLIEENAEYYLNSVKQWNVSDGVLTATFKTPSGGISSGGGGYGGGGGGGGGGAAAAATPTPAAAQPTAKPSETESGSVFTDVPPTYWAYDYIMDLYNAGVINGETATTFMPENNITRAEFTKIAAVIFDLKASSDTSVFTDVTAGDWFAPYVIAATEAGIVNGVSESEFAPDELITREQMSAIIGRYLGASSQAQMPYSDASDISDYAVPYVAGLTENGMLEGDETGTFRPQSNAQRAEAAALMDRVMKTLKPAAIPEASDAPAE